jgi:hypothetical protein
MDDVMHVESAKNPLYGVIAEFDSADDILEAAKRVYSEGYRKIEAYSPFPVHGLAEALGPDDNRIKWMIAGGGLIGVVGGLGLEYWVSSIAYPHNVGGKPLWSWPLFVPPAYECMILGACLTAFVGMFALNGLPRPHHPIFNAKRFELASQDRFFLCVEAEDPKFDKEEVSKFLADCKGEVSEVLHEDE